jgi:hypothetical protein
MVKKRRSFHPIFLGGNEIGEQRIASRDAQVA